MIRLMPSQKASQTFVRRAAKLRVPHPSRLCEGWDQQMWTQAFAYPTLCKERKGWGTRSLAARPTKS
jgi:hypothetical protein